MTLFLKIYKSRLRFVIFLILVLNIILFSQLNPNYSANIEDKLAYSDDYMNLNTSNIWANTSLTIDELALNNLTNYGNWNWAVNQPWCSGLGTFSKPYIIENLTLSIGSAEYGLAIKNSKNVYFTIQNVEAHGAIDPDEIGLLIYNSSNGIVQDCNFTSNFIGIYLSNDCDNNTLYRNDVSEGTCSSPSPIYHPEGILLDTKCDFNQIFNNTCNQGNGLMDDGIYLNNQCNNNTIKQNVIVGNDLAGVYLRSDCFNNTIINNNISSCLYGVDLYDFCENNYIAKNLIHHISYGVRFQSDSGNNKIYNNTISSASQRGISLSDSVNNTIIRNYINSNGYYGIYMHLWSSYNKFINNTIKNASQTGILIADSIEITLSGNKMLSCGIFIVGSETEVASHTIYLNNTANTKPVYYCKNQDGLTSANFPNAGQIILVNCSNSDVSFFTFTDVSVGIQILYTSDSTVSHNIITNCVNAYYQEGGENNQIYQNFFNNNIAGIDLENADFNTVSNNTVNQNGNYGIWLAFYCQNNTIFDNIGIQNGLGGLHIRNSWNNTCYTNYFSGSSRGIELLDGDENQIESNIIGNCQFGLLLQMGSSQNQIRSNNVSGSSTSGVHLLSNSDQNKFTNNIIKSSVGTGFTIINDNCNNNSIFLNAFISNNIQAQDSGVDTKWTNGGLGNYWDDYTGNDTDDDGIGDTPYFIPPNGIDDRPLMTFPYVGDIPSLPDLLIYNYTLTNSTLEITIKNIGESPATNIAFLVEIESIGLILYNHSLTHLTLAPNENFTFFIWLVPFSEYFELNSSYLIHISIDPQNLIEEQNELNNEVEILFTYQGFEDNEPPPFIFIISGYPLFIYPIVLLAICVLILRVKKRKQ